MKKKKIIRRNADETRARILGKATKLFAESGFAGTPISEIIKASKVNQRMVYHYFGDKEGLYRAVFVEQWSLLKVWFDQALQERLNVPHAKPLTSRELLLQALEISFDFLATNLGFVKLMMWEGLEGGHVSRSIWKDVRGPLFAQIEFLAKEAQREGILDTEIDTAHLIISFLGVISFYFAYASTLHDMLKQDPLSEKGLKERKEQVIKLLSGIMKV